MANLLHMLASRTPVIGWRPIRVEHAAELTGRVT
jgi:hypothetical protein